MITSELEYYLLCELITMDDRVLAQQIELLIWAKSPIPQEPILQKFLDMLTESKSSKDFYNKSLAYVNSFPCSWIVECEWNARRTAYRPEQARTMPQVRFTVFKEN